LGITSEHVCWGATCTPGVEMAERGIRPGWAALVAGWRRALAPGWRRYVAATLGVLTVVAVGGLTAWAGSHRPASATAAPSRAVAPAHGPPGGDRPGTLAGTDPPGPAGTDGIGAAGTDRPGAAGTDGPRSAGTDEPGAAGNDPPGDGPPLGAESGAAEPPLPPSPGPPTGAMTVRFRPSTRWDGGMVGYFAITNTTGTPVSGWRLVVTVPSDLAVTATWEATMRRAGNTITFTSTKTSARVDVGATVRFGLQASARNGYNLPLTCVINDAACA
jgi:cellulase/cellobiase CelA1